MSNSVIYRRFVLVPAAAIQTTCLSTQLTDLTLTCIRDRVNSILTDTGETVQKWTRVFSTRRWVILVARTRRKKREENSVSTVGRFRLWTSFESSPVSVKFGSRITSMIKCDTMFRSTFLVMILKSPLIAWRIWPDVLTPQPWSKWGQIMLNKFWSCFLMMQL